MYLGLAPCGPGELLQSCIVCIHCTSKQNRPYGLYAGQVLYMDLHAWTIVSGASPPIQFYLYRLYHTGQLGLAVKADIRRQYNVSICTRAR